MKRSARLVVVLALLLALLQQALLSALPARPAGTAPLLPAPADLLSAPVVRQFLPG